MERAYKFGLSFVCVYHTTLREIDMQNRAQFLSYYFQIKLYELKNSVHLHDQCQQKKNNTNRKRTTKVNMKISQRKI